MNKREIWVDNTKVFACILVVLGHFFQSMVASNIMPETDLYKWFNQTIYYFHVPLFFICSGYLYQKTSCVNSFASWKNNVLKKLITLGIPYIAFSTITWILKTVFSSDVNTQIGGLVPTLLKEPVSPYWYLYVLFFMFLIIPTFKNIKVMYVGLIVSVILKIASYLGNTDIYIIGKICENSVWFIFGMFLTTFNFKYVKLIKAGGCCLATLFLLLSVVLYVLEVEFIGTAFVLGFIACVSTIFIMISFFENGEQSKYFVYMSKYTMPIFLMHTIFAAGLRSVLLKVGISNIVIHFVLGLVISFIGPIIAAEIMKRLKWMEFFLYPGKYIKGKYN